MAAGVRDNHEITVLDHGIVEERNIRAGTQFYLREQIGISKTDALQYNIYKYFNQPVDILQKPFIVSDVNGMGLVIDCFDNFEARSAITEACRTIPCVHVGFSPNFTWSILWNEGYVPPEDPIKGFDICEMEGASSFTHLVSSLGALVAQNYLTTREKHEFVGNRLSVREIK